MDFRRTDIIRDIIEFVLDTADSNSNIHKKAREAQKAYEEETPTLHPDSPRCREGRGTGSLRGCVNPPVHRGGHNWID